MNPQTYALAAYIQGALSAHAIPASAVSGATLALITEGGIEHINNFLVVTNQATIHATMYKLGYQREKDRIAHMNGKGFYVLRHYPSRAEHKAARNTTRTQYRTEARPV